MTSEWVGYDELEAGDEILIGGEYRRFESQRPFANSRFRSIKAGGNFYLGTSTGIERRKKKPDFKALRSASGRKLYLVRSVDDEEVLVTSQNQLGEGNTVLVKAHELLDALADMGYS